MQSSLPLEALRALHVAIVMDGNGRWAQARGQGRHRGHRAGAGAVRRSVESAVEIGLGMLTLFAFSSDNWKRPQREVAGLLALFRTFLANEERRCIENGVRLTVIGRRDRMPRALVAAIEQAETATRFGTSLRLRIAIDYSARDAILRAAQQSCLDSAASREGFARLLGAASNEQEPVQDVDLLVRTGGELRFSDFLLWESAYAELYFTPVLWPDFTDEHLRAALGEYARRDRRFGAIARRPPAAPPAVGHG
jgi:undecaprenyl diphosphate synthase